MSTASPSEHNAESVRTVVPPDAEKLLAALDHLDAAYEAAKSVSAQVCSHIHLARVEAERLAGESMMRATRRAQIDGSIAPDGPT